jgi:hypothetical protein
MALPLFEHEQPFCANTVCQLHVQAGEPDVSGFGNWAEVNGILIGRGRYGARMLCDPCGRATVAEPFEVPQPQ